ncbi:MAG: hypothetical protein IT567_07135 [Alphaproteobacteria bacterium]|nr:hypothetical protein [Alphaproteobacteria bacterium]
MGLRHPSLLFLILFPLLLGGVDAHARLGIISPYVTRGKQEFFADGYYTLGSDSGDLRQRATYGLGLDDRLQLFGRVVADRDHSPKDFLRQAELGGKYELTDGLGWPVDLAIYASALFNYESAHSRGYQLRLLMGKKHDRVSITSNLMLTNDFGNGIEHGLAEFRWRGVYGLGEDSPYAVGGEYFGKFGTPERLMFDRAQEHLAGPLLSYRFNDAATGDLGMLFGLSDNAPDAMLKWRVSFSF